MKTAVKVTAKDGQVIVASTTKPEYGYIRVEQKQTEINEQGFVVKKNLSSLIKGKIADLKDLGFSEGQSVSGNIVIVESTSKPFEGAQPKRAGKDGEIITSNGMPVYRDTYLDFSGKKEHQLISADKVAVEVESLN